ncbi:EAL domain-containing protein [cf. Phormidesmis sp. LEGE 11477]|uniref:EAL domain-containing protein n=1 Tax=cf. Phormidesmis sp. LEGE 11477 TaxID=1828680 RepID=UPI0018816B2D|nr:EAL domain-containing protein [cf. Phormidesmis sp. LEGE 11477]MBE9064902.1 PTS sugar transporter subunit IIC/EAL domain-containing protein [cf. Phormidesmis sp. LEGE 11477]
MPTSVLRIKALSTLREAFLALLPVVLIMNSLVIMGKLIQIINIWGIPIPDVGSDAISRLYYFLLPLFVSLSLSTLLAQEKGLDQIGTLLIVMVCFLRGTGFLSISLDAQLSSYHGSVLTSILVTWIAIRLLHHFSTKPRLQLVSSRDPSRDEISPRLVSALNLIIPGFLTVLCVELLRLGAVRLVDMTLLAQTGFQIRPMEPVRELILYKAISLCSWLVGIHGEHSASGFFRSLYNTPVGDATAIQLNTFHAAFVNMGGTGSTLPIPFIILFSKRLSRFRAIAKISLPFSLFTINETLLFGLPILFNPVFLIPFLSTAFVNMAIALTAIHFNLFTVSPDPIYWMTPPFYKAYVASGGSGWAMLTQLVCIVIDGCIYYPFLLIAAQRYEAPKDLFDLFHKNNGRFLSEALVQRRETDFFTQQESHIKSAAVCQSVLSQLKKGRFLLYFQPKVSASTLKIVGLEALLRFQTHTGQIIPPTFLPTLYQQGLSKTVDQKVIDLVFDDLRHWQAKKIAIPPIALNFDKDFLLDTTAVKDFIRRAKEFGVYFCIEITEHTYVKEGKALALAVRHLRAAGHRISIDDFGSGYSSLTSLVSLEADEIKLDRALAVPAKNEVERGMVLLVSSIQLCHKLGFSVVAEGIETKDQLHLVQRCGVDVVQGYYLGRPVSLQQVNQYLLKTDYGEST